MTEAAIEARGLVKVYETAERRGLLRKVKRRVEALRGVSFEVRRGEIFGLLGPNGAGKTTTVKILCTLLLPDGGEAYVDGHNVVEEPEAVRTSIGVMLYVDKGFYAKLTGRENLEYFGTLYRIPRHELRRRIDEVLELVGLKELGAADRVYEEYSLGMRARLAFARALLKDPPILILDEPTLGLDPPSARRIREILRELRRQGKAILLTTHNMWEADILCDRIAIINRGKIVAIGTPSELKRKIGRLSVIRFELSTDAAEAAKALEGSSLAATIVPKGRELRVGVEGDPHDFLPELLLELERRGIRVKRVEISEPTLEDVFVKLTGEAYEPQGSA